MKPLKCRPSTGQMSITEAFPDLRPFANRTDSGLPQTGHPAFHWSSFLLPSF